MSETSTEDLQGIIRRHRFSLNLNFKNSTIKIRKQYDKVCIQIITLERELDTLNEMKEIMRNE